MAFKKIKDVTLPFLKLQNETLYYFKFTSPMFEGKKIEKGSKADMAPATLANVINLETGEKCQIICPAVLQGILRDEYGEDYVGRCFEIVKHREASQKYSTFSVAEVSDPDADDEPVEEVKTKKARK